MKLGIVGHAQEKFTPETEAKARARIHEVVIDLGAQAIISGRSPMGGVDWYAEDEAQAMGLPAIIFAPDVNIWEPANGGYGFKRRNLDIAKHSDIVLVVVVKELPPGFARQNFGQCYHCGKRVPPHVKSGACWTAWRAKLHRWEIIE